MRKQILFSVKEAIRAIQVLQEEKTLQFLEKAADMIVGTLQKGNKLLIAGNGGSLCDAMHFAEELTGQFRKKRKALPAIALSDPGHMSCVGNDFGFDAIFARGIEALGKEGDLLVLLSTSGNSSNLVWAQQMAQQKKMQTLAFLGKDGGKLRGLADLEWIVEGFCFSDRIQELHMTAIHILIEAVEEKLFYAQKKMDALVSNSK